MNLTASTVYRGGVTAPNLNYETKNVSLIAANDDRQIQFEFNISSKGGGTTAVNLSIGPEDFGAILQTMTMVDRSAAMREFAAALVKEIDKQDEVDRTNIRKGRQSVVIAAFNAREEYPVGQRQDQRSTWQRVEQFVAELNKKDASG